MKPSIVTFDLDGTLIRNTNTMELVCGMNGRFEDCVKIQDQISIEKTLDWVEGDYIRADYMKGADMGQLDAWVVSHAKLIEGLDELLTKLIENDVVPILITSGPRQVAQCIKKHFCFAEVYGSEYEEENGCMTGRILRHIAHHGGKYGCLVDYCRAHGLDETRSVAVGDSYSDAEIFAHVPRAIAINYTPDLEGLASAYYKTENIMDILPALLEDF